MKIGRLILAFAVAAALLDMAPQAHAQSAAVAVSACGAATYSAGQQYPLQQTTTGNLCSNASGGGGSSNATIVAPLGVQSQAASVATTINGALPAGTNALGSVSITSATHVQTTALASSQVIVGSAHQLTSFEVAADSTLSGAAWWIMIYDATSAPADGAVTPAKCYAMPNGATNFNGAFNSPPAFTTGIVIGVSTTGCFTKTASAHAFISGDYQ